MANWITAREAREVVAECYRASDDPKDIEVSFRQTEAAILRRLEHGALASKAQTMTFLDGDGKGDVERKNEVDWVLPASFWQTLVACSYSEQSLDWVAGDFSFAFDHADKSQGCLAAEMAFGVRFDRDSLPLDPSRATGATKGGRKPTWNWPEAVNGVWCRIYLGEFQPATQADVEQAVRSFLTHGDHEPSESGVRTHARLIWRGLKSGD